MIDNQTPSENRQADRQRTLAETQTAGFGIANGSIIQLLVLEFHESEPAIIVRHDRVEHPDPMDDRDPETTTVETVEVTPTGGNGGHRKIEIGTRHGSDRVRVGYHDHAPRAYVRHETEDGDWTEQAAWELHPMTGITQVAGRTATDGGTQLDDTTSIKFADELVPEVLNEEKNATVRKGGFEAVQVGNTLTATTTDESPFAELTVRRTASVQAVEAHHILSVFDADYPSDCPQDVIDALNDYYEDGVAPSTTVRVLVFEVVRHA